MQCVKHCLKKIFFVTFIFTSLTSSEFEHIHMFIGPFDFTHE